MGSIQSWDAKIPKGLIGLAFCELLSFMLDLIKHHEEIERTNLFFPLGKTTILG
jgi:hypothetical protein